MEQSPCLTKFLRCCVHGVSCDGRYQCSLTFGCLREGQACSIDGGAQNLLVEGEHPHRVFWPSHRAMALAFRFDGNVLAFALRVARRQAGEARTDLVAWLRESPDDDAPNGALRRLRCDPRNRRVVAARRDPTPATRPAAKYFVLESHPVPDPRLSPPPSPQAHMRRRISRRARATSAAAWAPGSEPSSGARPHRTHPHGR